MYTVAYLGFTQRGEQSVWGRAEAFFKFIHKFGCSRKRKCERQEHFSQCIRI